MLLLCGKKIKIKTWSDPKNQGFPNIGLLLSESIETSWIFWAMKREKANQLWQIGKAFWHIKKICTCQTRKPLVKRLLVLSQ